MAEYIITLKDGKTRRRFKMPDDLEAGSPKFVEEINRKNAMLEFDDPDQDKTLMKTVGAAVSNAYEKITDPIRQDVATLLQAPVAGWQRLADVPNPVPWVPEKGGVADTLASAVVPKTLTEAAIAAGTWAAGGPAAATAAKTGSKLMGVGMRMAGGTAGGALGGVMTGEGAISGAKEGIIGSGVGEVVGGLYSLGKGRLAKASARKAQSDQDAVTWGSVINDLQPLREIDPYSPTGRGVGNLFSGVQSSDDLLELANRRGHLELSKSFDDAMSYIDTHIMQNLPPHMQKIRDPLDPNKTLLFDRAFTNLKSMRYKTYEEPKLSAVNQKSFEADPAKDRAYREAVIRMRNDLDLLDAMSKRSGRLVAVFDFAREQYEFGNALLGLIRSGFKEGAESKGAKDILFNARDVQAKLSDARGPLTAKLGDEAFSSLEYAAGRATGKLGTVDVPHTGSLGMAGAVTLKGNVTGGLTGLSNALKRDELIGQKVPLGIGPTSQLFADLIAERSTGMYKTETGKRRGRQPKP